MKKILSLIAALCVATASFAQGDPGSISVTPRVGLSMAAMSNLEKSKLRLGVVAGADVQYQLGEVLALSGGVYYQQQGSKFGDNEASCTYKNDYINVPILLNAYIVKGLAVKLGVQPGFLVSAKLNGKINVPGFSFDESGKIKEYCNTVDFSIPVGVSYEFMHVVLEARYNWGLTKVFKKDTIFPDNSRNSVFQVSLGYRF